MYKHSYRTPTSNQIRQNISHRLLQLLPIIVSLGMAAKPLRCPSDLQFG
ncbi:hypothetical protein [Calothrix sp. UHCC 0171]|nr:hypothetical protein [Calothrix sp. UHCC 0171]MEA5573085.1 hypothetical protein [Calothrix sp. UHCC 0171]